MLETLRLRAQLVFFPEVDWRQRWWPLCGRLWVLSPLAGLAGQAGYAKLQLLVEPEVRSLRRLLLLLSVVVLDDRVWFYALCDIESTHDDA